MLSERLAGCSYGALGSAVEVSETACASSRNLDLVWPSAVVVFRRCSSKHHNYCVQVADAAHRMQAVTRCDDGVALVQDTPLERLALLPCHERMHLWWRVAHRILVDRMNILPCSLLGTNQYPQLLPHPLDCRCISIIDV